MIQLEDAIYELKNNIEFKGAKKLTENDVLIFLLALRSFLDLEEQGRLIELPCAVGDLVYMIKNMDTLVIPNPNKPPEIVQIMFGHRHIPLIGINVFLTKEEAEAKLKELEG